MKYVIAYASVVVISLWISPRVAVAACYSDGFSARLSNFCALDKMQGARVDIRTLRLVDHKLKQEGFGLGLVLSQHSP